MKNDSHDFKVLHNWMCVRRKGAMAPKGLYPSSASELFVNCFSTNIRGGAWQSLRPQTNLMLILDISIVSF